MTGQTDTLPRISWGFATFLGLGAIAVPAVLAFPQLVILGLILGILPGIVLALLPTLFPYALAWWGIRTLLLKRAVRAGMPKTDIARRHLVRAAGAAAALLVGAIGLTLPAILNMPTRHAVTALRAQDVSPPQPIALPGVVAVIMPGTYRYSADGLSCETLCWRLLFNGVASRVIVADAHHDTGTRWKDMRQPRPVTAFWIEKRDTACPAPAMLSNIRWKTDFPLTRYDKPEDRVKARIAAGECLIQGPGRLEDAQATISVTAVKKPADSIFDGAWSLMLNTVTANRLEIVAADGGVLYRRTEVIAEPLAPWLGIETRAGLLTTVTYAGWARSKVTEAEIGPHGRDVLPAVLGEAVRAPTW